MHARLQLAAQLHQDGELEKAVATYKQVFCEGSAESWPPAALAEQSSGAGPLLRPLPSPRIARAP